MKINSLKNQKYGPLIYTCSWTRLLRIQLWIEHCHLCLEGHLRLEALCLPSCMVLIKTFIILVTPSVGFNPISAGVLETQDMQGGGQFAPPPSSKSHVWCSNMTNDTSLESSCALLLESAKKFANLHELNFLSQNPVI